MESLVYTFGKQYSCSSDPCVECNVNEMMDVCFNCFNAICLSGKCSHKFDTNNNNNIIICNKCFQEINKKLYIADLHLLKKKLKKKLLI